MTAFNPQPGDIICDCRFKHIKVVERRGDDLLLEDGFRCSMLHCADPPDHDWPHPKNLCLVGRLRAAAGLQDDPAHWDGLLTEATDTIEGLCEVVRAYRRALSEFEADITDVEAARRVGEARDRLWDAVGRIDG